MRAWSLLERERRHGYDPFWSRRQNGTCGLSPLWNARKSVDVGHSLGLGDLWVRPPLLVGGEA